MITIGQLIKLLELLPKDLPIGTTDWFGGFLPMSEHDFRVHELINHETVILDIECPNRGPEPD